MNDSDSEFRTDGGEDGGLSLPVVGTVSLAVVIIAVLVVFVLAVLLIAAVIVVAAVLGTFVLGAGVETTATGTGTVSPQVSLDFEYDADADRVSITHAGGDGFTQSNTGRLTVGVEAGTTEVNLPFEAGDEVVVQDVDGKTTVEVVWTGPDGSETTVVGSFETP